MRISLVGPVYPYKGGIAHFTTSLTAKLIKRDHQILLISFKRQYPSWLYPGGSDRDPSKRPLSIDDPKYWIDSLNPITWLVTLNRIAKYKTEILVLQWWTPFWAPTWIFFGLMNRLFLRIPLVFICHNVLPHETGKLDKFIVQLVLHWGSQFSVQSNSEKEVLNSIVQNKISSVVPLPIFDMFAELRESKIVARKKLNISAEDKLLLFFGIVRPYKGLKDLLYALPGLISVFGSEVKLLVAGEFWESKEEYNHIIEKFNLGSSVIIHDRYIPNEDLGIYFSAADLVVAPYKHTTGSAVVEMAKGFDVPVVTTWAEIRVDGTQEVFITPPGDVVSLTETILRFFREKSSKTNETEISTLGDNESWEQLIAVIESAYKSRPRKK